MRLCVQGPLVPFPDVPWTQKFNHPFQRKKKPAYGGMLAFALYIAATVGYVIIRSMFTLPLQYVVRVQVAVSSLTTHVVLEGCVM